MPFKSKCASIFRAANPATTRLVDKLRYNLSPRRRLRNPEGPPGRHDKIRKIVTALLKYERLELGYYRADESRGYVERLISDAIRYGECHKPTMEMASYWILEPQLVHKLFRVLAPRYQNYDISYTRMWRAPIPLNKGCELQCVLELRNNIYPPLGEDKTNHKNIIHNVLLQAAKQVYEKEKALKKIQEGAAEKNQIDSACETSSEAVKFLDKKEKEKIKQESQSSNSERVKMSDKNEKELSNVENVENLETNSVSDIEQKLEKVEISDGEKTESTKKDSDH